MLVVAYDRWEIMPWPYYVGDLNSSRSSARPTLHYSYQERCIMSIPDSTEYWWAQDKDRQRFKFRFTHAPGLDCGHYHCCESKIIEDIDVVHRLRNVESQLSMCANDPILNDLQIIREYLESLSETTDILNNKGEQHETRV